jgi:UDP-glucose 4-epimerase
MKVVVTGGAGFIGSNLVDRLLTEGHFVRILDNFSTGKREFVAQSSSDSRCEIVSGDLLDTKILNECFNEVDAVVHLAANADVRFGWEHPRRDLEQNVIATQNVLEAMRANRVKRIVFSSTGSVYGESPTNPTPEHAPFPRQTSLYGASKAAAEGLIAAYAENDLCSATVFRFVSILGPRYTHGHVIDFVAQLIKDPSRLRILGDGTQRKSYLHVSDCVNAIVQQLDQDYRFEVFNLGAEEFCRVAESASWICDRMGLKPALDFGRSDRGWVGDNPFIYLDTAKIRATGWSSNYSIKQSVEATVDWLLNNRWVLNSAVM